MLHSSLIKYLKFIIGHKKSFLSKDKSGKPINYTICKKIYKLQSMDFIQVKFITVYKIINEL